MLAPFALLGVQSALIAWGPPAPILRVALPATILAAVPLLAQFLRLWGVRLVMVGLAMNLAVILANGGLMPVTPDTVSLLAGPARQAELVLGEPIAGSKDVMLDQVRLSPLRDRFILRAGRIHAVYSPGDVVVVAGLLLVLIELSIELARLPGTGFRRNAATPGPMRPGAGL